MQNRPWRRWLATAALCGTASWAGATPPLTMVVPSGAGSAPDIVARLLGDELTQRLGQPVVIDNRPGAGGIVATLAAKSAKADGNTVLLAQAAVVTLTPLLYRAAKYDMARDFEAYNAVWAEHFPDAASAPCRTTVGITALPTPIAIELKCIARIED